MKRHLLLLIIAVLFSTASAFAQDCDYSGTIGELEWCLKEGTLTISGEGEMPYGSPWREYQEFINTCIIENGVTTIASSAFPYCANFGHTQPAVSVIPGHFCAFMTSKNAMQNYCFFLKLSPFNSIRCDVWTILSKIASAKVSSLKRSNQFATGS